MLVIISSNFQTLIFGTHCFLIWEWSNWCQKGSWIFPQKHGKQWDKDSNPTHLSPKPFPSCYTTPFFKTCDTTIKFIFGKYTEPTVPTTFWKIVVKEFPCFLQLTSRIVYMSFHLTAQSQRDWSELQNSKWELPKQNGCWVIDDLLLECLKNVLFSHRSFHVKEDALHFLFFSEVM